MNMIKHPIRFEDRHVGEQIKARRNVLGLTQSNVGQALGISFQQLQKYETGANRVSASKICDLATALHCLPSYFFEGIGEEIDTECPLDRDEMQMLEFMRGMGDEPLRALLDIAKQIADTNAARQPVRHEKGRG